MPRSMINMKSMSRSPPFRISNGRKSFNLSKQVIVLRTTSCDEGGAYLTTKARILERAGAGFLIVLSNTRHRAASLCTQRRGDSRRFPRRRQ
ncbi:hypothetical protein MY4824_007112 [Beauveria thailandica]